MAAASMAASIACTCLPSHRMSSRAGLACRAMGRIEALANNSSFNGARLQVRSRTSSRNQNSSFSRSIIRAAGAKGDYLVRKVSARELDDILSKERDVPIVVDFYATWCGPCILLAQQLEQLAVEYNENVRFLKVDSDEEHELCAQMEIRGLPTMVFVSPDTEKLAIRTEGLLPTDVIRDIIEKELEASKWTHPYEEMQGSPPKGTLETTSSY